jgi:hypothetical protein
MSMTVGGGYNSAPYPLAPLTDALRDAGASRSNYRQQMQLANYNHELQQVRDAANHQRHQENMILGSALTMLGDDLNHQNTMTRMGAQAKIDAKSAKKQFKRTKKITGMTQAHDAGMQTQRLDHEAKQNKLDRAAGTRQRNQEARLATDLGTNPAIQPGSASFGPASVSRPQPPKPPTARKPRGNTPPKPPAPPTP